MNIKTQCCGLVILLIVLYFYIYHAKINLRAGRAFALFLIVTLLSACLDILSVWAIVNMWSVNPLLLEIICKAYILSVVAAAVTSLIYVCADIYRDIKIYKRIRAALAVYFILAIICVSVLPIKYYYEPSGGIVYTYGSSVTTGYIFGVVVLLTLLFHMIFKSGNMNPQRRNAVVVWIVIWMVAVGTQFLNNELLLLSFAGSIGIVIVYLFLENPETNLDRDTGAFNRSALGYYVDQLYNEGKEFAVLEIAFDGGIEGAAFDICRFLIKRSSARVFRYSSNNIMLISEGNLSINEIRKTVTEMLKESIGKENGVVMPYWFYMPDSKIVSSGKDFLNLIKYVHYNVTDRTSSDITYIDAAMARDMHENILMAKMLDEAVKNNKIEVFYQPIYSVAEDRFNSAEALVRIRDENGGIISPGKFIDIAEKNGMILKLGAMVFEKVCGFLSSPEFETLGIDYVEANLSVMQCSQRGLASDFVSIMEKYNVNPTRVSLEITETASVGVKKIMLGNMAELMDFGVKFALDDFGTGHSNLNYIAEMPANILKFDMSMTRSYFESDKAKYVIDAAISMAKGMNMKIVFEGIETKEQYLEAKRIGIDYIQGYYFAKPMPEDEFCSFLKKNL